MVPLGIIATIISVVLWTIASTISKKVSRDLGSHTVAFLYLAFSILPILIATAIVGVYSITFYGLALAILGGIFLSIGFIYGFKALQTENLASVVTLGELLPALLVVFGIFILGEKVTMLQTISIIVIFGGALMIITTEKFRINRRLVPAIISTFAWTGYWIALSYSITSANTFALPILISRLVGVPFIIWYLLSNKAATRSISNLGEKLKRNRTFLVLVSFTLIASFSDAVGDVLFGITVGSPSLALGAALVALQPMLVSFFAFLLYKERLTKLQLYGLLIMIIGALALSLL